MRRLADELMAIGGEQVEANNAAQTTQSHREHEAKLTQPLE
jgi:hypothetical protein